MNPQTQNVEFEYQGKKYVGRYTVQDQLLTVYFGLEKKSSLLSGDPPETLAVLLLSELVVEKVKKK